MNGQEGNLELRFDLGTFAFLRGESIENGVSLELTKDYLKHKCAALTPFSVELCVDFIINTYRLDRTRSDKHRAVRLSYYLGNVFIGSDIFRLKINEPITLIIEFLGKLTSTPIITLAKKNNVLFISCYIDAIF